MRRFRARSQPGREHELAALEQVVGVGHLDHVRPADLALQRAVADDQLRQRPAHDGQVQHIGKAQHDGPSCIIAEHPTHCPLRAFPVTGKVVNGQTEGVRVADTQAEADIHLEGVTQALRRHDGGRRPHALDPARELLRHARPVGLRQDDDAADDRRLREPDRRAACSSAAPTSPTSRPTSATSTPSFSPTRCSRT